MLLRPAAATETSRQSGSNHLRDDPPPGPVNPRVDPDCGFLYFMKSSGYGSTAIPAGGDRVYPSGMHSLGPKRGVGCPSRDHECLPWAVDI